MNDIRKFLIPAIIFASTFVVFLTRALYSPDQLVLASSEVPELELESVDQPPDVPIQGEGDQAGCSIPASYPQEVLQWCQPIEQYALYYGLDPNLIAAVMLQESGGNPDAYSKSGAVGLMQVMPRDGLAAEFMCVNGPCFSARPSMDELFDPYFNIDFGAGLLSGLISRSGSLREGLRAYGPMDRGYYYSDLVLEIYERYQD